MEVWTADQLLDLENAAMELMECAEQLRGSLGSSTLSDTVQTPIDEAVETIERLIDQIGTFATDA